MRFKNYLGFIFGLSVLIATIITPQQAKAVNYTVTPSTLGNCTAMREGSGTTGGFNFALGPTGVPAGVGSFMADTPNMADGFAIFCGQPAYLGVRLDTITTLSYSTYTSTSPQAFSLFINIDYDVTDMVTSWQGRLSFEPYFTFVVTPGTWQTWNALSGRWWASSAPGNTVCPQTSPCTWAEVLTAFPNAGIHPTFGAIGNKAGSGWTGVTGYVDNLRLATSGGIDDTYNYEPDTPILTLTKSAPVTVQEGETFTYSLTLSNTSTLASANNIVITDVLPTEVVYVSNDGGCSESSGTVTCNIATLGTSSSITINITVTTIGVAGDIITNSATVDADELATPLSSNIVNTGIDVVPPVVVVPPVQAPAPPQCNEPNGDIVAFALPDGIYCRTLYANGAWRWTPGSVPIELIDAGAIRAVDIYRVTGGSVVNGEFGVGVPVCLSGVGRMVFLDASTSPRTPVDIASFVNGTFTCAFITHSGTLVLLP
ncbi:MAG: hypothetical protein CUN52_03970 [Phototrophicales bacterium]|nr:MAG: hypothetical protein CUN52_03970 [Phototrophicales bacterium]